jgi:hypothetical protein
MEGSRESNKYISKKSLMLIAQEKLIETLLPLRPQMCEFNAYISDRSDEDVSCHDMKKKKFRFCGLFYYQEEMEVEQVSKSLLIAQEKLIETLPLRPQM